MSSNLNFRRVMTVALATGAIAVPAAQGQHAPGASDGTAGRASLANEKHDPVPTSVWRASSREVDRLGPKYVPLQHPINETPVVRIVRPAGFDWADASVGAGVAGLALSLVAVLTMIVARRSRQTNEPVSV